MSKGEKKTAYFVKLESLLSTYKTIFVVNVGNISSQQMLSPDLDQPNYEARQPFVRGNIGFVFANSDMKSIHEKIISNRVAAPARVGGIAPVDVYVSARNTGMEPGQLSFFQALSIPTKITHGTIEIFSDVHLVKAGEKVSAANVTLLNMLGIFPFEYGLSVEQIYHDGTTFSPAILDITEEDMLARLVEGITTIVSISLATNYAITAAELIKELLDNPEAMAAAAATA
ncbi:ribosomal protein P0 (A0) (L10E) [Coemansia erecta]|nr:ribosomal protein P0 (A0) (L10E) [Coemansia erecta]